MKSKETITSKAFNPKSKTTSKPNRDFPKRNAKLKSKGHQYQPRNSANSMFEVMTAKIFSGSSMAEHHNNSHRVMATKRIEHNKLSAKASGNLTLMNVSDTMRPRTKTLCAITRCFTTLGVRAKAGIVAITNKAIEARVQPIRNANPVCFQLKIANVAHTEAIEYDTDADEARADRSLFPNKWFRTSVQSLATCLTKVACPDRKVLCLSVDRTHHSSNLLWIRPCSSS